MKRAFRTITISGLTLVMSATASLNPTPLHASPSASQSDLFLLPNGKARLVVKTADAGYELVQTDLATLASREAELLAQPGVISVERDTATQLPQPVSANTLTLSAGPLNTNHTAGASYSESQQSGNDNGPLYNDPLYASQYQFFPNLLGENARLESSHHRLNGRHTARIGVIDTNFLRTHEVDYAEGVNFIRDEHGRARHSSEYEMSEHDKECTSYSQGASPKPHGYFVSQVAAAATNNGSGIAGAGLNAEVVAARTADCGYLGSAFYMAEAIRFLAGIPVADIGQISQPVQVINISMGGRDACPSFMQDAINAARSQGATIVVAAGNSNTDAGEFYPGNCKGVITVAAHTATGARVSAFSNTGNVVDIVAQGDDIRVLDAKGSPTRVAGTSYASPLVAGALASLVSDKPNITPAKIDSLLAHSGHPVSSGTGAGILDTMLLLDNAGIPRKTRAVKSAALGTREKLIRTLSHPTASDFIQEQTGTNLCGLIEFDGDALSATRESDPLTVFRVPNYGELNPSRPDATLIASSHARQLILTATELKAGESSGNDRYGLARCDTTTGSRCSEGTTVQRILPAHINKPAACT